MEIYNAQKSSLTSAMSAIYQLICGGGIRPVLENSIADKRGRSSLQTLMGVLGLTAVQAVLLSVVYGYWQEQGFGIRVRDLAAVLQSASPVQMAQLEELRKKRLLLCLDMQSGTRYFINRSYLESLMPVSFAPTLPAA